ncbi:hypothetical protein BOTBODRAFT_184788 [Botryobasidium botryosum FD-172 SS1]|uniref:Uncharacterized protein n=1 Tax=Botryobasidium botryosum (strain FD-172 SS1) TaxID=930990 RepID=A0A067MWA2_BOTB1|nr:hypothetical protein BOTBODRAFT_184788 [Botryobasidium botryosum FD-172 SS1]
MPNLAREYLALDGEDALPTFSENSNEARISSPSARLGPLQAQAGDQVKSKIINAAQGDDEESIPCDVPPPPTLGQLMESGPYHPNRHALTQHLRRLHSKFWNRGDDARAIILSTGIRQFGGKAEEFTLMNLGPGFETFFGGHSTILVREEYKRLIAALSVPNRDEYGAGLLGQPGIGKSTFIYYLLVERILSGQRTILQCQYDVIYELHEGGVKAWLRDNFFPSPSDDWALVDTSDSLTAPHTNLRGTHFTITAFKPAPAAWQRWCYAENAIIAVVKPWTKHEIVYAGLKISNPPLDTGRLQEAYDSHGPSPRLCFCFALYPQCMAEWKRDTVEAIAKVAAKDPNLFATRCLGREWDPPSLYHQVFLVDVSDNGHGQKVSIISPLVVQLIVEELDRHGGPEVWEEFDMFRISSFHESGRCIWAMHSMNAIVGGITRQTKLHCLSRPPDANRVLESVELTLPLPSPLPYGNLESLPQELNKAHARPTLFQPKIRTEGAFDSILVAQDYIAFFDATISRLVGATSAGLYERLDALVGALKAANMSQRLPSESCRWRLVFLVPKKDLACWEYVPDWRKKVPKGSWKEHLDAYVFCPEAGVLEIQERPRSVAASRSKV